VFNPLVARALVAITAIAMVLWVLAHISFAVVLKATLVLGKVVGLAGSILSP
jgi:hypothetical protein